MGTGRRIPMFNATLLMILSTLVWPCFGKNSTLFCRDEERSALLELKQSLTCTPPDLLRSWQGKEDCCNWKGVGCDPKSGHIVKLELLPLSDDEGKQFSATELSPSLLKLRSLSHLDLGGFQFSQHQAVFPEFLGSMKQLRFLNLSAISFSGSYHHLGNLTSLEVLDLHKAGSTIDDIRWISRLTGLEYLDMSGLFMLAHNVMRVLGTLRSLSYLALSACGIHNSHLPYARDSNTSFFPSLSHLDLSENFFDGTYPDIFQNMTSISYLDLARNQFDSFGSPFWSNPNLRHLDMSDNDFKGQLPSLLQNMTSLTFLGLSGNHFSSVPLWFVSLKSLVHLDLSYNSFENYEGGLTLLVRDKCDLRSLRLHGAGFKGEMTARNSTWFCASNLESFTASDNQFQGELPDWLGTLSSLTELDISSNQLHGSIPEGLGQSRYLRSLRLQGNRLNGAIPESLGQLQDLVQLDLSDNSLEGAVSQVHFANLSKLEYLNLGDNSLAIRVDSDWKPSFQLSEIHMGSCNFGTLLPQWLRKQDSAYIWDLSNANIVGELPEWFGDLAQNSITGDFIGTWYLDLSYNQISGPVPNFSAFKGTLLLSYNKISGPVSDFAFEGYLDLSHNQITGPFPNFSALPGSLDLSFNRISGPVPNFALAGILDLSHNQISGPVPNFSALTGSLDLSYNQISGTFPKLTEFRGSLYLSHNKISGSIPSNLKFWGHLDLSLNNISGSIPSNLEFMRNLGLSHNQISGPIPSDLKCTSFLDLSHNQISGPIPNLSTYGESLDLSYNMISGTIPASIGPSNLNYLYLNDNLITGTIPTSLCDAEALYELDLSRNKLSGSIPDCGANGSSPFIDFINLSSNNLSGLIPSSFRNLSSLESLQLSDNNLHGDLPEALQYAGMLKVLDVGENNIDGEIPGTWKDLQSLRILRLRDNQLHGRIPPELCFLSELHVLDLAINNFEGTIPDCLGNMSGMMQVASADPVLGKDLVVAPWNHERVVVVMKGRDLEYTTILRYVIALDLSSNNLVGLIPEELTRLQGVIGLNLSHNYLSGEMPEKIGDMQLLESLDLSNNQLSGAIPSSISDLSMLSHLNLSDNNFSGRIPKGKQLDTLSEPGSSIYAGNPLLCGEPLPKKCPGEEVPTTPETNTSSEGSESVEKAIFYGVTSTGFMTGFWGAFAVLVFKKKWRIAYFRLAEEIAGIAYVAVAVKVAWLKRRMRST